jgi:hypothetical protein
MSEECRRAGFFWHVLWWCFANLWLGTTVILSTRLRLDRSLCKGSIKMNESFFRIYHTTYFSLIFLVYETVTLMFLVAWPWISEMRNSTASSRSQDLLFDSPSTFRMVSEMSFRRRLLWFWCSQSSTTAGCFVSDAGDCQMDRLCRIKKQ